MSILELLGFDLTAMPGQRVKASDWAKGGGLRGNTIRQSVPNHGPRGVIGTHMNTYEHLEATLRAEKNKHGNH